MVLAGLVLMGLVRLVLVGPVLPVLARLVLVGPVLSGQVGRLLAASRPVSHRLVPASLTGARPTGCLLAAAAPRHPGLATSLLSTAWTTLR